jgi:hypothetical protein
MIDPPTAALTLLGDEDERFGGRGSRTRLVDDDPRRDAAVSQSLGIRHVEEGGRSPGWPPDDGGSLPKQPADTVGGKETKETGDIAGGQARRPLTGQFADCGPFGRWNRLSSGGFRIRVF